jgi:hypothetical protein
MARYVGLETTGHVLLETPGGLLLEDSTPPGETPAGRFLLAFDADTLEPNPDWTRIDAWSSLLTSYTIDRGRSYELDRTDVGRATVQISDTEGILDPTNVDGPFFGKIEPLLQAMIGRYNPVTAAWVTRFRGFIEEMDYSFDPSQQVNRLTITLVDIFEIVNAVKMWPGDFGDPPPDESAGQVFFDNAHADDRIIEVLGNAGIPVEWYVVFSLNVTLWEAVYSPAESAMTAIQEAADADFPGVANVFTDRLGRLAVHGRHARFDPVGVASGADEGTWDFHQWHAGDGAAVQASPATTAHIRRFAANRGLAKIINSALATPQGIADDDVEGQIVKDTTSIGRFGIRSWEAQNLLTKVGLADGAVALVETRRFAEYYVSNYSLPRNRVTDIQFRSMRPDVSGASENWRLLSLVDIGDTCSVTVASPGGGGLVDEPYFVEGVHEEVRPLNPDYDDVTVRLDLSPRAYFTVDPWAFP